VSSPPEAAVPQPTAWRRKQDSAIELSPDELEEVLEPQEVTASGVRDAIRVRLRGQELHAALAESLRLLPAHDDAVSAAHACIRALLLCVPCRVACAHLYDPGRDQFVVVSAHGPDADFILLSHTRSDALLAAATAKRAPVVFDERFAPIFACSERFAGTPGPRLLMTAPVLHRDGIIGALELADPLDGVGFSASDLDAFKLAASHLALFLETHGVVIDSEKAVRLCLGAAKASCG